MKRLLITEKLFEFERKDNLQAEMGIGLSSIIDKESAEAGMSSQKEVWAIIYGSKKILEYVILNYGISHLSSYDLSHLFKRGIKDNNLNYIKAAITNGTNLDYISPSIITKKLDKNILEYLSTLDIDILMKDAIGLAYDDKYYIKHRDRLYSQMVKDIPNDELEQYLSKTKLKERRGTRLYKILEFVSIEKRRYIDIIKFIFELNRGENTFDPIEDRGYYSVAMQKYRQYFDINDKMYSLASSGYRKMQKMKDELGPEMPKLFK